MALQEITDDTFESIVNTGVTLVDFWAPWCGPCKMLIPIVEKVSAEFEGRVNFAKVNIDNEPELAARFGIQTIPTLLVFKDGEMVQSVSGLQKESSIQAMLNTALN